MRGIPASFILVFFVFVILVEVISLLGIRTMLKQATRNTKLISYIIYLIISLTTIGLLLFLFSNPENIRHTRNYSAFYFVISLGILTLVPKTVFSVFTLLSYPIRWLGGIRSHQLLLTGSFILCCGIFFTFAGGIFIGRQEVKVEKVDLYFDDLPQQIDGFKISQLSDIHLGSYGRNKKVMDQTIALTGQLHPDLMLFTGDLVNNFNSEIKGFETDLARLSGKYGKYAILGNHDYGDYSTWPDTIAKRQNLDSTKQAIRDAGFDLLLNQSVKIQVEDTCFYLIGVENWGHHPFPQYANLDAATKGIPSHSFRILMSHDPAHWSSVILPKTDIPLTLSGHTHGGQMGIRIAGMEFSPMSLVQKYWGGLYEEDHQKLYVNRGLGTIGFKGRIDMSPEITLLTLHRSKNH
ncbi:MAG: metallophosphoesterase [Candidatus Saccharibacteria bacterium]